jgi:AMME syndrome candidate gene 1 protein
VFATCGNRHYCFPTSCSPLFVCWEMLSKKNSPKLRGCIGSLTPRYLHDALEEYALHSSLRDTRFEPIQNSELPLLMCKVSLLHSTELSRHCFDWNIGKHGIIVQFEDRSGMLNLDKTWSATYLPDVAMQEGWSKVKTIDSLIRKTGYEGCITDDLRNSLEVTRYETSVTKMTFQEYSSEQDRKLLRKF